MIEEAKVQDRNRKPLRFIDAMMMVANDETGDRRYSPHLSKNELAKPTPSQVDAIEAAEFLNAIPQKDMIEAAWRFYWHLSEYNLKDAGALSRLSPPEEYAARGKKLAAVHQRNLSLIQKFRDLLESVDGINPRQIELVSQLKVLTFRFQKEFEGGGPMGGMIWYRIDSHKNKKELREIIDRLCKRYSLPATETAKKKLVDSL